MQQRRQDVMSGAAVDSLARQLCRNRGLVNSGVLIQIHPEEEGYEVVAASAASHIAPRDPFSRAAPVVYGDERVTLAMWREWIEDTLVEGQIEADYLNEG